jgi:hypothetical protein
LARMAAVVESQPRFSPLRHSSLAAMAIDFALRHPDFIHREKDVIKK